MQPRLRELRLCDRPIAIPPAPRGVVVLIITLQMGMFGAFGIAGHVAIGIAHQRPFHHRSWPRAGATRWVALLAGCGKHPAAARLAAVMQLAAGLLRGVCLAGRATASGQSEF